MKKGFKTLITLVLGVVIVATGMSPVAFAEDSAAPAAATADEAEEIWPALCAGDEEALCWRALVSLNRLFPATVAGAKAKWKRIGEAERAKFNAAWMKDLRWALEQAFPAHPAMPEKGWASADEEAIQTFLGDGDRVEVLRAYLRPPPRREAAPGLMIALPPYRSGGAASVAKGDGPCDTSGGCRKAAAKVKGRGGLRLVQAI